MMTVGLPKEQSAGYWRSFREIETGILNALADRQEAWLKSWAQILLPRHLFCQAYSNNLHEKREVAQWLREHDIHLEVYAGESGFIYLYRGQALLDRFDLFVSSSTLKWESPYCDPGIDPVTGMRWGGDFSMIGPIS